MSLSKSPTNFLMVGNPGTGKSTILNGLIGQPRFRSGLSYGSGMTYQFDKACIGPHTFMDTPGLSDTNKRKQAAAAITEALKQNGFYKIFFVITLQNGRVKPEDVATLKLVLDAAPITNYGIIINQVPPKEYRVLTEGSLESPGEPLEAVLKALWGTLEEEKISPHVHLVRRDEDLEGEDNVVKALPSDLVAFIETTPGMDINSSSVSDVRGSEFEAVVEQMEGKMQALERNNKTLQETLEKSDAETKRLRENVAEQQRRMLAALQASAAETQGLRDSIAKQNKKMETARRKNEAATKASEDSLTKARGESTPTPRLAKRVRKR